jgi:hypothetical protein
LRMQNARALRVVYDALENLVPSTFSEESFKIYLEQHGFSTTDARNNAKTLVAAVAAEGDLINEDTALNYMYNPTNNFANLRDEYGQHLLNGNVITMINGAAGLGPPKERMSTSVAAMAIRRHDNDDEAYRIVDVVQMQGFLNGSIYERGQRLKTAVRDCLKYTNGVVAAVATVC